MKRLFTFFPLCIFLLLGSVVGQAQKSQKSAGTVAASAVPSGCTQTITVSAGANGSISPGTGTVNCGDNAVYTITPNPCYSIADVSVDGVFQGAVSSYTFTNVNASHTISATFFQNIYAIAASAGTGGTITPGSGIVNCGSNAAYNITPDACYSIANVSVDGVSQGAIGSYTFSNVSSNHTITASFILNTYTITSSAATHGTISPATGPVSCGNNETYTITPDICSSVADVLVDGISQGAISTYTFSNVTANHTISVTFASDTPAVSIAVTNTNCASAPHGVIQVTATGNEAPYQYSLDMGPYQSSGTFSGLTAGNYQIYILGSRGCLSTAKATVNQPKTISATFTVTNLTCYASNDGTVTVTPTSGTGPYMYKMGTTGTYQSSPTFTGLRANVLYRIYIQDNVGCTGYTDQISVTQPQPISSSFTVSDANCFGTATGSVTVTPSGGTSPYMYKIGSTGTYQNTSTFSNLKAGSNYRVYIQDAGGCTAHTELITIGQPLAITATTMATDATCFGVSNGVIVVTASHGTTPYMYKLGSMGTYQSSSTFSSVRAGTGYRVYIQDAHGCTAITGLIDIGQPVLVTGTFTATDPTCAGANNGMITVTPTTGTGPYMYKLGTTGTYQSSPAFTGLKPRNNYRVYIKDAGSCVGYTDIIVINESGNACKSSVARVVKEVKPTDNNKLEATLSPNPASGAFSLQIHSASNEAATIRVMNANGTEVYKTQAQPGQALTFGEAFGNGVYSIQISQGKEMKTLRGVKIK